MLIRCITFGIIGTAITFVVKALILHYFGINILTDIFNYPKTVFFALAFSKISTVFTYIYLSLNLDLLNGIIKGDIKVDITDKSYMKRGPDANEVSDNNKDNKVSIKNNKVDIDSVNMMKNSSGSAKGDNAGEGSSINRNEK
jgi:hypothetical protein